MNLELKGAFGNDPRVTDYGDQFVFPLTPGGMSRQRGLKESRDPSYQDNPSSQQTKSSTDDLAATSAQAFPGEMPSSSGARWAWGQDSRMLIPTFNNSNYALFVSQTTFFFPSDFMGAKDLSIP